MLPSSKSTLFHSPNSSDLLSASKCFSVNIACCRTLCQPENVSQAWNCLSLDMSPCLPFQWHQVWLNKCGRHVYDSSLHQHWHQILLMNSPLGPYFFLYSSTWTRRKVKMRDRKMEEYEKIRQQKVLHLSRAQTPLFINTEVLGALLPGLQERRISLDNGTRCMNFISLSRIVTTWILSWEQIWIFKCSGKAWFLRNF